MGSKLFTIKTKAICSLFLCFIVESISAQKATPEFIEQDLLKSYKAISYWDNDKFPYRQVDPIFLVKVNMAFAKKLKSYTCKYPFTITQQFAQLSKQGLKIVTSNNNSFRIYSWDNEMGDFDNVIQYRSENATTSVFITDTVKKGDQGYVYRYNNMFTMKVNNKAFYIGVYNGEFFLNRLLERVYVFLRSKTVY